MFPRFEEPTASIPGAPSAAIPAQPSANVAAKAIRLKQTLAGVGAKLRSEDTALHLRGPHVRPGGDIDAGMQTIQMLERGIASDPEAEGSDEAQNALAQARALRPVMIDIQAIEADPGLGAAPVPAAGMVHEAGIMNLTEDHHLPVPPNLAAGSIIIEHLGHALGHADGSLARKSTPAAKNLREAIGEAGIVTDENDLEAVLAPHESDKDSIKPE